MEVITSGTLGKEIIFHLLGVCPALILLASMGKNRSLLSSSSTRSIGHHGHPVQWHLSLRCWKSWREVELRGAWVP